MKISARNVIKGKVKEVKKGAVNAEVIIEISGSLELVSIITKTSADTMGLKAGKDVYAIIKASNIMVGID